MTPYQQEELVKAAYQVTGAIALGHQCDPGLKERIDRLAWALSSSPTAIPAPSGGPTYSVLMATLLAENASLRALLAEAADDLADWGQYAGDYLVAKHHLADDIARYRKAAGTGA